VSLAEFLMVTVGGDQRSIEREELIDREVRSRAVFLGSRSCRCHQTMIGPLADIITTAMFSK